MLAASGRLDMVLPLTLNIGLGVGRCLPRIAWTIFQILFVGVRGESLLT